MITKYKTICKVIFMSINYRKDIDGLRALAVISVVLFHLDVSWIKSGFLGVDIFLLFLDI